MSKHNGHNRYEFLNAHAMEFFQAYLDSQSPSGQEAEGQDLWVEHIRPYVDEVSKDPYGSAIAVIRNVPGMKVVIAAHADEIAWMVNYIMPDGYLRVEGTADPATALARPVTIRTRKGMVEGIMGWPATHIRDEKKEPEAHDLFIDCGCASKEEVEKLGIRVGDTVVYTTALAILNERLLVGRALDNRIGGLILTEIARYLKEKAITLPFSLYFVNAVQEEVGTKGATMVVESIKPDIALVTDVTHDTSMPDVKKAKHGDIACGKGPVLSYGPAVHNQIVELIEEAATKEKIPYQRAAAMRTTGTDTDAFAYGAGGTRSALISVPIKYMHTPVESCDRTTVIDTCRLIIATLERIGQNLPKAKGRNQNANLRTDSVH